jgi:ribosomal protein S18 acetylase RimI-like enzyme
MDIKIETARSEGWKTIQRLNNQVFQADKENDDDLDLNWSFSEKGISYYHKLANGEYGKCFIAYLDGKAVDYVALHLKDFGYRKSKYVEIENIGVDPAYRSLGIGKLLMDRTVEWAKEQQATKLYVVAFWNNKRTIKFYKQHGFYESGLEMDRKL